jgi:hypothetical protein
VTLTHSRCLLRRRLPRSTHSGCSSHFDFPIACMACGALTLDLGRRRITLHSWVMPSSIRPALCLIPRSRILVQLACLPMPHPLKYRGDAGPVHAGPLSQRPSSEPGTRVSGFSGGPTHSQVSHDVASLGLMRGVMKPCARIAHWLHLAAGALHSGRSRQQWGNPLHVVPNLVDISSSAETGFHWPQRQRFAITSTGFHIAPFVFPFSQEHGFDA